MHLAVHDGHRPPRSERASLTGRLARLAAGVLLVVALSAAGDWLVRALAVPVPGSVVGMLALTALLELGVLREALVRPAADLLLRNLALLYVPAGVALVVYAATLRHDLPAIAVAAAASLLATLAVIGLVIERLTGRS